MMVLPFSADRFRFAARYGLFHMAASGLVAILVALLIFRLWFPYPYRELTGGRELFWLIISVDVVCGPLLTWVVASPSKSRRQLMADIGTVAVLQLAALGYGTYILSQARPVALVFEVDRFRAVTAADIETKDLDEADPTVKTLSLAGPLLYGIREPKNADESFDAITQGLSGLDTSMRPNWWVPYSKVEKKALAKARPLSDLRTKYASKADQIDQAVGQSGVPETQLVWLPLVSRKSAEWVVMLDKASAQPKAYLPLDGFF